MKDYSAIDCVWCLLGGGGNRGASVNNKPERIVNKSTTAERKKRGKMLLCLEICLPAAFNVSIDRLKLFNTLALLFG